MADGPNVPFQPLSLGQRPGLSHDTKKDLGYGISKEKFHQSRKNATAFPYIDDEEYDIDSIDVEEDPVILKKISNKLGTQNVADSLIGRSADKFAMANGNIRVGIGEQAKNSLVPFPNMYKKRLQVGGGVNSPKLISPGQYNRTGTYRGWSKAPVPLDVDLGGKHEAHDDEETSELEALDHVRQVVRSVLRNNMKET